MDAWRRKENRWTQKPGGGRGAREAAVGEGGGREREIGRGRNSAANRTPWRMRAGAAGVGPRKEGGVADGCAGMRSSLGGEGTRKLFQRKVSPITKPPQTQVPFPLPCGLWVLGCRLWLPQRQTSHHESSSRSIDWTKGSGGRRTLKLAPSRATAHRVPPSCKFPECLRGEPTQYKYLPAQPQGRRNSYFVSSYEVRGSASQRVLRRTQRTKVPTDQEPSPRLR